MRLIELMQEQVVAISPEDTVEAARVLMERHRIRHLPVVDGRSVVGMVSDSDVRPRALPELARDDAYFAATPIARVMNKDVITLGPKDTAREAANLMRSRKLDCIAVVEGHKLVGVLTATDLLALIAGAPSASHPRPHVANDPRRQDRAATRKTSRY